MDSHPCSSRSSGEAGFTLVEMLVVAVLLALLASILYGTISGILQGRAIIESERETGRVAQYVFERMTRELTARVLTPLSTTGGEESGRNTLGARYYFYGENNGEGRTQRDRLRFVSSNAAQALIGKTTNHGLVEVEYRLEEDDQQTREERSADGLESMVLVREELPAEVADQDTRDARRTVFPLARGVVSLNFRFLKEGKWQDEWKEQFARLPEAVEITLRVRAAEDRVETYRTAVMVMRPPKRP